MISTYAAYSEYSQTVSSKILPVQSQQLKF